MSLRPGSTTLRYLILPHMKYRSYLIPDMIKVGWLGSLKVVSCAM